MEIMAKRLTVPKWGLTVWPKIPQMPQNLSAQFVCPSPKFWDFDGKRLHWASVVRECSQRRLVLDFLASIYLNDIQFLLTDLDQIV